jgi:hypothetical protein
MTAARASGTPAASARRQNPSSIAASLSPASPAATTQSAMAEKAVSTVTRVSNVKKDQVYTFEFTCFCHQEQGISDGGNRRLLR